MHGNHRGSSVHRESPDFLFSNPPRSCLPLPIHVRGRPFPGYWLWNGHERFLLRYVVIGELMGEAAAATGSGEVMDPCQRAIGRGVVELTSQCPDHRALVQAFKSRKWLAT